MAMRFRRDCVLGKARRPQQLLAEQVLAEMAVCWEVAAFAGSLRVFASVASGIGETVRQLKQSFRAPFLYILASPSSGNHHSAGVRWQLGTESSEHLPSLGTNQGGLLSGNVEAVVSNGHLYVLAEAIKFGSKGSALQTFDPLRWEWIFLTHVSCECEAFLELSGQLYILGRNLTHDGQWVPKLLRYDTRMGEANSRSKCEVLPAMPMARRYVGAAVLDDCIYAVGGYVADMAHDGPVQALDVAEKFNPAGHDDNGPWTALPHMKCPRFLCKALAVKGCLYVLAGLTSDGVETALERFDPSAGTWSLLKPMQVSKGAIGVAECAGRILVFGGADKAGFRQPEVESYEPKENRWRKLPNIGSGNANLGSAAVVGTPGNMLAVFTELCKRNADLVIQRYDERCAVDSTSPMSRVPSHHGHRVRVVMVKDME